MLVIEIIVSAFAAWGIFCAMKLAAEAWLIPKKFRPVPAMRLDGDEDNNEIRALYENAGASWLYTGGDTIFLIPDDSEFETRIKELKLYRVRIIREKRQIIQK
ncbi:MAG: hypothetical protein MJ102_07210 [Clostridia bacterium]|nr:hypothetical protein [Clostridia bacterium]